MTLPVYPKLFKKNERKKQSSAYLRVSLAIVTSLSMLLSTFPFQVLLANAQNSTNTTEILPVISQEEQQQLAANGTSFDGFVKHRIAAHINSSKSFYLAVRIAALYFTHKLDRARH